MKCFLKLGKLDYKLIYPFLCLVFSIAEIIVESHAFERKRGHIVVSLLINSVGKTIIILVFFSIKCCCYRNISLIENTKTFLILIKKEKKNNLQKYLRNKFFIVLVNIASYMIYIVYYVVSRKVKNSREKDETITYVSHGYGFYYCEGIEIIIIFIFTKFLLKYEFYVYNLISLIIFIIFSMAIDIVNYGDIIYESGGVKCFLLIIGVLLFESLVVIIQRNLMDNLYYSPYLICFSFGLMDFILSLIFGTITTLKDGLYCNIVKDEKKCYLPSIKTYFTNFRLIDYISLISSVFFKSATYIFNVFTIFYLTPNHMFISYMLTKFFQNQKEGYYGNWIYIVFPIQLFVLFIYLEIIEINICGINLNTKKNIQDRADDEFYSDIRLSINEINENEVKEKNDEKNKNKEEQNHNNSSIETDTEVDVDENYKITLKKRKHGTQ